MITHCPSCQTGFRVHAEQLAARSGLVRCGKCSRVFDAHEFLLEEDALAGAPAAMLEPTTTQAAAGFGIEGQEGATPGRVRALDASVEAGSAISSAVEEESQPVQLPDAETTAAPAADAFDFGPAANVHAIERGRRWPWILGALLLVLALLAQAAYHYRSAIIVLFPEVKPYAAMACVKLGCDLPLPRRIELLSIEASDLQADTNNPNVMVLSATLKNRAIFEQQLPLLELTLTDAQDQPVVRRVLTPSDYLGKIAGAKSGFAANTEIAIKVFIEGSQVKATGYRLYLFYP